MENQGSSQQYVGGPLFEHLEPRKLLSISFVEQPIPGYAEDEAVLADFDGDGDVDFAALGGGGLAVRLNNGNGSFGPPATFAIPYSFYAPFTFTTGDYNGDGALDIVIGTVVDDATFLPGVGDGSFGSAATVDGMRNAESLWTTDFSGDGIDDIVAVEGNTFLLAQSNGDGTFTQIAVHSFGISNATIISLDDFNGDAVDDIAVYGSDSLQIWMGEAGGFVKGPMSSIESYPAVGDFDGDGIADIAWSVNSPQRMVRRSLNPGDGQFNSSSVVATGQDHWSLGTPRAIDVDGDHVLDLVITHYHSFIAGFLAIHLYEGDNSGGFGEGEKLLELRLSSKEEFVSSIQWADTTGDGALDIFAFFEDQGSNFSRLTKSFASLINPPEIGSVSSPTEPVMPGTNMRITVFGVAPTSGRSISSVRIYEDTDKDGIYSNDPAGVGSDVLYGSATPDGSTPGQWSLDSLIQDGQFSGLKRFFAVATDSAGASSDSTALDILFWSRIYFPEGWRNDATITEVLSLFNPLGFSIAYRVIARYETGERDAVIAEGMLDQDTHLKLTLSERGNSSAALVRPDVGYALEVQSNFNIAASLLREDNFGVPGATDRTTNAEALNAHASNRWGFADVSTKGHDFLLFYNPFERDIVLRVAFSFETGEPITLWQPLAALRRGGLNLREMNALSPNIDYSVEITSDEAFSAAFSRYGEADGTGSTSLGQMYTKTKAFDWIGLEANKPFALILFNPSDLALSVEIELAFDDPSATVTRETVLVNAMSRTQFDLNSFIPAGASTASLKLESSTSFYSKATTPNPTMADSTHSQSPGVAAQEWFFANPTVQNDPSEDWLVLTNSHSQARAVVSISFIIDGTRSFRSVTVQAGQTVRIRLNDEPSIQSFPNSTPYAIRLFAATYPATSHAITATLTHFDSATGVGWQSFGTMFGPKTML